MNILCDSHLEIEQGTCDDILFEPKECQKFKIFYNPLFGENIQEGLKGDICVDNVSPSLSCPNLDCVIHIDHNLKIEFKL